MQVFLKKNCENFKDPCNKKRNEEDASQFAVKKTVFYKYYEIRPRFKKSPILTGAQQKTMAKIDECHKAETTSPVLALEEIHENHAMERI